jgi:tripartite-type tricarboxylate transporter receptor subunit TctC
MAKMPGVIMNRITLVLMAAVSAGAAVPALSAQPVRDDAASFPSKPVRWVVGFTPGASNDVIARTVGARLSEAWGQQVIVDNRPGATGMIAGEIVARAVPDGYTLLLATGGPNTIAPQLTRKPLYRVEDFEYVSVVAYTPLIIVVTPSLAAKTPRELVEHLKANPGKTNWGSAGVNSSPHVGLATLEYATGTRTMHVPYKGAAAALIDVASGQIDAMLTSAASAEAAIRGNRVRVIAVAGPKRVPAIPDVPTLAEAGIKDGDSLVWFGMAVPLRTPQAIVRKLNAGVNSALAIAEVQRRLTDLGMEIVGGSPEAAAKFVREEAERIRGLLKAGVLKQE